MKVGIREPLLAARAGAHFVASPQLGAQAFLGEPPNASEDRPGPTTPPGTLRHDRRPDREPQVTRGSTGFAIVSGWHNGKIKVLQANP